MGGLLGNASWSQVRNGEQVLSQDKDKGRIMLLCWPQNMILCPPINSLHAHCDQA